MKNLIEFLYLDGINVKLFLNLTFFSIMVTSMCIGKHFQWFYEMFGLISCEHIKCISISNIINVIFNISSIMIMMTSNMSIIYCCTPLWYQLERRLINGNNLEREHSNHGWIHNLFNYHKKFINQLRENLLRLIK